MASGKVSLGTRPPIKITQNRLNDYIYDPLYTFSSQRDFEKAATTALLRSAQIKIQPKFFSMFSDLCQYPNSDFALIRNQIPKAVDRSWPGKVYSQSRPPQSVDVLGNTMTLFVARPGEHCETFHLETPTKTEPPAVSFKSKPKARGTQTKYRESSAQTSPFEPPYKVMSGDPEAITLSYLSWGAGLPAGMHECKIIERARIRRAWEKYLTGEDLDQVRDYIIKMEHNEWAFREQEINDIFEIRMELMLKMLEKTYLQLSERALIKLRYFWAAKQYEKNEKINKLKKATNRDLRKLEMKHKKVDRRYKPMNIVDAHLNFGSELYGPLLRHGSHPKRFHFDCPKGTYIAKFQGIENFDTTPKWLNAVNQIELHDLSTPKDKTKKLCLRETRWTLDNLAKLHEDLKQSRMDKQHARTVPLRTPKVKELSPPPTPVVFDPIYDPVEESYQATLNLQKVIRGRAIQSIIYEGRARNHELIEELKSTHALQEADMALRNAERIDIIKQQRARLLKTQNVVKMEEVLKSLEGGTLASMLDYLNKELQRLEDERRVHALALMALRERWKREAAEAGRRQKEERRRLEHDEMFRQVIKIHQETVDLYLEDIITQGMDHQADVDAKAMVYKMAEMIDNAVDNCDDYLEQEELTADLIHNFVIPEVDKQIVRSNLRKKQEKYLLSAHNAIYGEIQTPCTLDENQKIIKNIDTALDDAIHRLTSAKSQQGEDGFVVVADIEDQIKQLSVKLDQLPQQQ